MKAWDEGCWDRWLHQGLDSTDAVESGQMRAVSKPLQVFSHPERASNEPWPHRSLCHSLPFAVDAVLRSST